MKKILFPLIAILLVLTGCAKNDEEVQTLECLGQFKIEYRNTVTTEDKAAIDSYKEQLNARGVALLGSTYQLEFDNDTYKISDKSYRYVTGTLSSDSEIKSIETKIFAMTDADGNYLVKRYYYTIFCGSSSQGIWEVVNTSYK